MAQEKMHVYEGADMAKRSFKYFVELKNKKELCDVTVQVGGESISAHRIILAAVIPYFRGIFCPEEAQKDVSMPDVDPDALKCLIEFAYTCEVKIDKENVRSLLAASIYLGVDEVRDACCDFLIDCLENDNALNIRELANSLKCSELLTSADNYIKTNFEDVAKAQDFLLCPPTYLRELVARDDIKVSNEEQVLEAILKWVNSSSKERSFELPELIRNVRMTLLDPVYMAKIVAQENIIRSSILCRDLIDEARNYVLHPELRKNKCSFVTKPRITTKTVDTMDKGCQYICKLKVEMKFRAHHFDLAEKNWSSHHEKIYFINEGSSAEVHKKMYFFCSDNTREYDPSNNLYKSLNSMPTPRFFTAATALKNRIYVCGGKIGSLPSNAVECFDPEQDEWASMCLMQISCWGPSSVALADYIFVLGGNGFSSALDTIQRYDSVTDRWKTMSSLLTKRYCASAATLNGKIYICGGLVLADQTSTNVSATAEIYDPVQNRSTFISSMNNVRRDLTLLSCHGKLYALGGKDGDEKSVQGMDLYDPEDGKWTREQTDDNVRVSSAVVM